MKILIFLLFSFPFLINAQEIKPIKNYILINLGNSTPLIGVNYLRSFGHSISGKTLKHFEYGAGIGFHPQIFSTSNSKFNDLLVSHNFSYVHGRKNISWVAGYNGIIAERNVFINENSIYTPNPFVGMRLEYLGLIFNLNANGYFYTKNDKVIVNENELVERITSRFLSIPGVSIGFKF
jgi:hypothetical protein